MRKSRCCSPLTKEDVMLMIETSYLMTVIYILFYSLIGTTIITITLIIALAIILSN